MLNMQFGLMSTQFHFRICKKGRGSEVSVFCKWQSRYRNTSDWAMARNAIYIQYVFCQMKKKNNFFFDNAVQFTKTIKPSGFLSR